MFCLGAHCARHRPCGACFNMFTLQHTRPWYRHAFWCGIEPLIKIVWGRHEFCLLDRKYGFQEALFNENREINLHSNAFSLTLIPIIVHVVVVVLILPICVFYIFVSNVVKCKTSFRRCSVVTVNGEQQKQVIQEQWLSATPASLLRRQQTAWDGLWPVAIINKTRSDKQHVRRTDCPLQ